MKPNYSDFPFPDSSIFHCVSTIETLKHHRAHYAHLCMFILMLFMLSISNFANQMRSVVRLTWNDCQDYARLAKRKIANPASQQAGRQATLKVTLFFNHRPNSVYSFVFSLSSQRCRRYLYLLMLLLSYFVLRTEIYGAVHQCAFFLSRARSLACSPMHSARFNTHVYKHTHTPFGVP